MPSTDWDTSVNVHEMAGSPQENLTEKGLTATCRLLCDWGDRYTVANEVIGDSILYPHAPGSLARAKTGTIEGFGKCERVGDLVVYTKAIVTVNFEQFDGEDDGVDIFAESIEPLIEFITLSHEDFRWGSDTGDPLLPAEAPGMMIVGFDYVQTRYELSAVPAAVLTAIGHVNSASVSATLLGLTFAAQTLLFSSSVPTRTLKSDGTGKWTLTSRFSFRANTWNKVWRAETETFESIYHKDGGGTPELIYPTSASLPIV